MNPIIISRDKAAGTVTISETDLTALILGYDNGEDVRSVQAVMAKIALGGMEAFRASCLTADEAQRVLDGETVLRVMREKRGLTQAQIGDLAGLSAATIGMIETGQRKPSVSALIRLAKVLKLSTDDLL